MAGLSAYGSRDRILPELSESLGRYAQGRMEARGVEFRLNTRLTDARPGVVVLGDVEIPAKTLVWTAGTAPNPSSKSLPIEKDKRGAVIVDTTLAVAGHPGVWALGDCAADSGCKSACSDMKVHTKQQRRKFGDLQGATFPSRIDRGRRGNAPRRGKLNNDASGARVVSLMGKRN